MLTAPAGAVLLVVFILVGILRCYLLAAITVLAVRAIQLALGSG